MQKRMYSVWCGLLVLGMVVACAPIKVLDVWEEDGYAGDLQNVMVIAVTKQGYIRRQLENNLAYELALRGVQAVPSNKSFPELSPELDRATAEAKIRQMGIDKVLVIRAISQEEITNHQLGGLFFAPTSVHYDGWYTYYTGSFQFRQRAYDTDYFTVAATLYDLASERVVWTYLSRVRVSGSRQAAVNKYIPTVIEELEDSDLLL